MDQKVHGPGHMTILRFASRYSLLFGLVGLTACSGGASDPLEASASEGEAASVGRCDLFDATGPTRGKVHQMVPINYCTTTEQCIDFGIVNGSRFYYWAMRESVSAACTSGPGAGHGLIDGYCSYSEGYCTDQLQCEQHKWVWRAGDPAQCTHGPGSAACGRNVNACF